MDWIVEKGTVAIPDGVSFEQACFVEPVNTCMKGIQTLRLESDETVLVIGQGPIGLILSVLAARTGVRVITSDLYPARLTISRELGLEHTIDASQADTVRTIRELTDGRGAVAVILAVAANALIRSAMDATRPGGRVLLFAQTVRGEATIDPAAICVDEKTLLGSYSASVELQEESVRFVMNREMELEHLISHRFPLSESVEALHSAADPQPDSMKIVIQPGSAWEGVHCEWKNDGRRSLRQRGHQDRTSAHPARWRWRSSGQSASGSYLRHRLEGLPARLSRAHDYSTGSFRTRVGGYD